MKNYEVKSMRSEGCLCPVFTDAEGTWDLLTTIIEITYKGGSIMRISEVNLTSDFAYTLYSRGEKAFLREYKQEFAKAEGVISYMNFMDDIHRMVYAYMTSLSESAISAECWWKSFEDTGESVMKFFDGTSTADNISVLLTVLVNEIERSIEAFDKRSYYHYTLELKERE